MIALKTMAYYGNHLFPVLLQRVNAMVSDPFATSDVGNENAVRVELNAAVIRALRSMIKDEQAHSVID